MANSSGFEIKTLRDTETRKNVPKIAKARAYKVKSQYIKFLIRLTCQGPALNC